MATETPFLKLRKSATTDLVDVRQDVVHNLDIIDRYAGDPISEPWREFRNPVTNLPYKLIRSKYKIIGNMLIYQANVQATGAATGTIIINLPPGCELHSNMSIGTSNALGQMIGIAKGGSSHTGAIYVPDTVGQRFVAKVAGSQAGAVGFWNTTVPFTWATNSVLTFTIQTVLAVKPNGL